MGQLSEFIMSTYPLGLHSPYLTKGAKELLKRSVLLLIKDLHVKQGEMTEEQKQLILEIGNVLNLRYDSAVRQ